MCKTCRKLQCANTHLAGIPVGVIDTGIVRLVQPLPKDDLTQGWVRQQHPHHLHQPRNASSTTPTSIHHPHQPNHETPTTPPPIPPTRHQPPYHLHQPHHWLDTTTCINHPTTYTNHTNTQTPTTPPPTPTPPTPDTTHPTTYTNTRHQPPHHLHQHPDTNNPTTYTNYTNTQTPITPPPIPTKPWTINSNTTYPQPTPTKLWTIKHPTPTTSMPCANQHPHWPHMSKHLGLRCPLHIYLNPYDLDVPNLGIKILHTLMPSSSADDFHQTSAGKTFNQHFNAVWALL